MPLYRGDAITLDTRLRVGETVKVALFNKKRTKVYLNYELPPTDKSLDSKPAGYGLPGGGIEKEETIRDAAYSETRNETGFVTEPRDILYVHAKKNHDPLAANPHRLIVILSDILPSDGQAESVTSGEYTPQARIVETDEGDPALNGWYPIDNLPIQICEGDVPKREGTYISHFLYLYRMYADGVINIKPFCADIMHLVVEKVNELDAYRRERLGETAEAVVAPDASGETGDNNTGWTEEAVKALGGNSAPADETEDEKWCRWAESPVTA